MRPDTETVFDPDTYVTGVPYDALARLRREHAVVWVEEVPVLGWPGGPGFWLVLRHADVESVLRRPRLFSSWLGATRIRDPATPDALAHVRTMMLNMDPPDHSRLRRLLARSFPPRAVDELTDRIRSHATAICDRVFVGAGDVCDFATDVAADLPLLTLADLLGMPAAHCGRGAAALVDAGHDVPPHRDGRLRAGRAPHPPHLARVQMRELFAEVLRRTSALRGAGRRDRLRSNFQHGVKHLPVAWTV